MTIAHVGIATVVNLRKFFLPATLDEGAFKMDQPNVNTQQSRGDVSAEAEAAYVAPPTGIKEETVQATKFDGTKPRMALIPVRAKREVAAVFTFGANLDPERGLVKYGVGNWHSGDGFDYDRLQSAAERHMDEFALGNRFDPESKRHILAHAICSLMMLLEHDLTHHGNDNRNQTQYLPGGIEE